MKALLRHHDIAHCTPGFKSKDCTCGEQCHFATPHCGRRGSDNDGDAIEDDIDRGFGAGEPPGHLHGLFEGIGRAQMHGADHRVVAVMGDEDDGMRRHDPCHDLDLPLVRLGRVSGHQ